MLVDSDSIERMFVLCADLDGLGSILMGVSLALDFCDPIDREVEKHLRSELDVALFPNAPYLLVDAPLKDNLSG